MKVSELGEFGLIRRIRDFSPRTTRSVLVGIGDDAAALKLSARHNLLVTTDLLIEDVHFDFSYTDHYSLGWKAAAVNLSDVAAMGGKPLFCLTAIGIPRATDAESIMDFYRGFNDLLCLHRAFLVGGDTCSSRDRFVISVTATGEAKPGSIIKRSGARPGDRIFVTGTLGDSAAGMELLKMQGARRRVRNKETKAGQSENAVKWLQLRHLRPNPRVNEGRMIAHSGCASAMIDISDGLSSDIHHICTESGVGAQVLSDRIPLSAPLLHISGRRSKRAVEYALSGGEDYELLFTVPPARLGRLHALGIRVAEIGTVTRGSAVALLDSAGRKSPLPPKGYDHFGRIRPVKRSDRS